MHFIKLVDALAKVVAVALSESFGQRMLELTTSIHHAIGYGW